MYSISKTSGVAAQLFSPKKCSQGPLMVICKKGFDVILHLEDERPSKQKYPNCRHNFGRTRPVVR